MITSLPRPSDLIYIKHYDSKKLRSFKSDIAGFYSGHGLLCNWKFDILKNFTSSDEGHSSKNMDQFMKGYVTSTKSKPSKPKKEAIQNEIKVEAENSTEAEAISKKELPIALEGEAVLNTVPTAQPDHKTERKNVVANKLNSTVESESDLYMR